LRESSESVAREEIRASDLPFHPFKHLVFVKPVDSLGALSS
jgi:hypothetical protein